MAATKKPARVPKTIKLPWNNVAGIAASRDGKLVAVGGELGKLARLDTETWKMEPWPGVDGSVNHLAVADDGTRVAVCVAGTGKTMVEIRDATGAVVQKIPTPRNVRARFSPAGDLLIARVEAHADHPLYGLAFLDPRAGTYSRIDVGEVEQAFACFIGNGEEALASARRKGMDPRESSRALKVARDGAVRDLGPSLWDTTALHPLGADRALVCEGHLGWRIVSASDATTLVEGKDHHTASALDGDGFVIAGIRGKGLKRYDGEGRLRPGGELAASKLFAGVAGAAGRVFLLQRGSPGQVEILG